MLMPGLIAKVCDLKVVVRKAASQALPAARSHTPARAARLRDAPFVTGASAARRR
jgi:hypothetical protein